jgi:aminopeptidase N
VLPNHKDLAYCKIRFDERSLATLTESLRDLHDPLARTLCWNALWDMVRDGELAARRYVDIVLNNVGAETDIGVVGDLIGRIAGAIEVYGDPSNRDASWLKAAARLRELVDGAEKGSDFQLAYTRGFIGAATSEQDLAFVRGLLDGTQSIDGVEIDTDLRWGIVTTLASAGAIDDGVIAAELERDPTDQGERYAAGARASIPTSDAKAEAWGIATEDAQLTLAMLRAVAIGFNRPSQNALLAPYAERYFDELLGFWERRELDLGLAFAGGFYPRTYTQDVVDATDKLLAGELPGPVRRILLEQKDETERVLRTRAADV